MTMYPMYLFPIDFCYYHKRIICQFNIIVLVSKQICNYALIIIFILLLSSQIYVLLQVNAVTSNLAMREDPLPQDLQEGVDSDEWSDED